MSRFASEVFAQSPALILPLIALWLFVMAFIVVLVRVLHMRRADLNRYAQLPLDDEPVAAEVNIEGESRHE
jgi:hypothetical protein